MTERTAESVRQRTAYRLTRWVLLTGNRLLVSLVALLGMGVLFVISGLFGLATVTTPTRVMWYLNGTVNGLLTLIPIAVGVNQIILSHEFGSIRDLYQRREDVTEYRERIGQRTGRTLSSAHASTFFGTLLGTVSDTARSLQQRDGSAGSKEVSDEIEAVASSIYDRADTRKEQLDAGDQTMFRTLVVMLDYDNSRDFDEVRRLRETVGDSGDTTELLRQIEKLFIDIDAGRQFLKTVVVERQLARLSRLLIYTGIPALAFAVLGIFTYRDVVGVTVPHGLLVILAGALIVATLVPLVVLGAYILRVATIARRTAAFGPFVPESDG